MKKEGRGPAQKDLNGEEKCDTIIKTARSRKTAGRRTVYDIQGFHGTQTFRSRTRDDETSRFERKQRGDRQRADGADD